MLWARLFLFACILAQSITTPMIQARPLICLLTDIKTENVLVYRSTPSATNNPDDPVLPLEIRIVDLGSAAFETDWHQPLIGTNEYRAPEAILQVRIE
jgi:serine/threonine protein kinase